jgi:hypothetical protein
MKAIFLLLAVSLVSFTTFANIDNDKDNTERKLPRANSQHFKSAELASTVKTMTTFLEKKDVPSLNDEVSISEEQKEKYVQALTKVKEWKGNKVQ